MDIIVKIKNKIKTKIKEFKAEMDLIDSSIEAKQKEYEKRFGDPEDTEVMDIIEELGKEKEIKGDNNDR